MRSVGKSRLNLPTLFIMPASNITAIIAMRPEPQIPIGRVPPIVLSLGSKLIGSIKKSSIAPEIALVPNSIPPPSKEGPALHAAHIIQSLFPNTIGAYIHEKG